jgi:hypothetical protein
MKWLRLKAAWLTIAALAMGCSVVFESPASAAFQERGAGDSKSLPANVRKPVEKVDLSDLNSFQSEMRSVIERYVADRGSLGRFYTVEISPVRYASMSQFLSEWLSTLGRLNFDAMSVDGKIDYLLFKNYLEHEIRQLEIRSKAFAEAAQLVPFAKTISDLEDARRRLERVDSANVAALLTRLA